MCILERSAFEMQHGIMSHIAIIHVGECKRAYLNGSELIKRLKAIVLHASFSVISFVIKPMIQSQDVKAGTSIAYMCHKFSLQLEKIVFTIIVWLSGTVYPQICAALIVFQVLIFHLKTGLLCYSFFCLLLVYMLLHSFLCLLQL